MKNPPAFQFYARDWLADADVRMMSYEERGVYIDLLCYCWERDGLPTEPKEIARLLSLPLKKMEAMLPRLLEHFQFHKNDKELTVFHNDKLLKAKDLYKLRSLKAQDKANRRWHNGDDATAMLQHCPGNAIIAEADAVVVNPVSNSTSARGRDTDFPNPATDPKGERCPSFVEFYKNYPLKENRQGAYRAWYKLRPSPELQETIHKHVELSKLSRKWLDGFITQPATYLNGARWDDEIQGPRTDTRTPKQRQENFAGVDYDSLVSD